jgi:8-oxo-dGTP pyrophosphatase MutT (NUDIX family)
MRSWPGIHVFPGGVLDERIDTTTKWLDILLDPKNSFKVKENLYLSTKCFKGFINENSLGSAANKYNFEALKLPNEISYRLCAIRETFEETG